MILKLTRILSEGSILVRVNSDSIQWYQPDTKNGTDMLLQNGPNLYFHETPEQIDDMLKED